jgi:hypothetical protein
MSAIAVSGGYDVGQVALGNTRPERTATRMDRCVGSFADYAF